MKREKIDQILNNADLDNAAKIDAILNIRGEEVNAHNARYKQLEDDYNALVASSEAHKDYDAIKAEVETLRAEKADRAMSDRFNAVVGGKKFLNTYTADGVKKAFVDALALEENKGKTDAEIFAKLEEGKGPEWYGSSVRFSMTPSAGHIETPNNAEDYVSAKHENNPWYGK